jgi:hypothetical protein
MEVAIVPALTLRLHLLFVRRYFECNYSGSDASFMDELFGTFRSSFK